MEERLLELNPYFEKSMSQLDLLAATPAAALGSCRKKIKSDEEIEAALAGLQDEKVGTVLRAKGIVVCAEGGWLHFDYTPGEPEVRTGAADYTGRLCVIGAHLNEKALKELFKA